jgi:hypothetical protein
MIDIYHVNAALGIVDAIADAILAAASAPQPFERGVQRGPTRPGLTLSGPSMNSQAANAATAGRVSLSARFAPGERCTVNKGSSVAPTSPLTFTCPPVSHAAGHLVRTDGLASGESGLHPGRPSRRF